MTVLLACSVLYEARPRAHLPLMIVGPSSPARATLSHLIVRQIYLETWPRACGYMIMLIHGHEMATSTGIHTKSFGTSLMQMRCMWRLPMPLVRGQTSTATTLLDSARYGKFRYQAQSDIADHGYRTKCPPMYVYKPLCIQ